MPVIGQTVYFCLYPEGCEDLSNLSDGVRLRILACILQVLNSYPTTVIGQIVDISSYSIGLEHLSPPVMGQIITIWLHAARLEQLSAPSGK